MTSDFCKDKSSNESGIKTEFKPMLFELVQFEPTYTLWCQEYVNISKITFILM